MAPASRWEPATVCWWLPRLFLFCFLWDISEPSHFEQWVGCSSQRFVESELWQKTFTLNTPLQPQLKAMWVTCFFSKIEPLWNKPNITFYVFYSIDSLLQMHLKSKISVFKMKESPKHSWIFLISILLNVKNVVFWDYYLSGFKCNSYVVEWESIPTFFKCSFSPWAKGRRSNLGLLD